MCEELCDRCIATAVRSWDSRTGASAAGHWRLVRRDNSAVGGGSDAETVLSWDTPGKR